MPLKIFGQKKDIKHLLPPEFLKGAHIDFDTAISAKKMPKIAENLKNYGLNALIIDIRSIPGPTLFKDPEKTKILLNNLHKQNFYLIARVVVFCGSKKNWHDPSSQTRWKQIAEISKQAINLGFDEINYDYIRYGSVNEPQSATPVLQRIQTLNAFFNFLKIEITDKTGHSISADIFGIVLLAPQKKIGQNASNMSEIFNYVCPMTYPSHWRKGSFGIENPAHEPYKTVYKNIIYWNKIKINPNTKAKLRVWIQAFNLDSNMKPYKYTTWHINEQIRACNDIKCNGWILWNDGSYYPNDVLEGTK